MRLWEAEARLDAILDAGDWLTAEEIAAAARVSQRRAARHLAALNGWGKLDARAVLDDHGIDSVRFRFKDEYLPGGRPVMRVLIGAQGSGKSTYARTVGWQILSSDEHRRLVSGDESDQDAAVEAYDRLHKTLARALRNGDPVIVDATNVAPDHRAMLLAIAADTGARPEAVVLSTPLDICLARNAERPGPPPGKRWGRRVSDDKVTAVWRTIKELAPAQLLAEGFESATWVDGRSAQ